MRRFLTAAGLIAATLFANGPASAQRLDWRPGAFRLAGVGVPLLFPELRGTPRGRAFVMRNFDLNGDGRVNRREADAANAAFARHAGPARARFDWDRAPVLVVEERFAVPVAPLQVYRFRDTPEGARFTLAEEVLFATDSDRLRPGAVERLRPLAAYLRANPRVRVAIDGHTDARASDDYNQGLSERRAAAVHAALEDLGAEGARFRVRGFGETRPVASNASPAGRRENRRVEVTLIGRRAAEFAER